MSDVAAYRIMKDSKVQWLGDIPSTWSTRLLKYMFAIKKNIAGETGHQVLSVTQRGVIPKNMTERGQFALDYSKYQLVKAGDFVMNHMDLLTGWIDISKYDGVTSPDYRVFMNTNPTIFHSGYYKYIFQHCYTNRVFYGLGQGVAGFGRWRLPADMFMNFVLPVPPVDEQERIAQFLDEQCAQIDFAIAEEKRSVEEYKSWKKSIILEAVTKGLNKRVKMKDSGVVWIGQIPYTWTCCKQKYVIKLINGRAYKDAEFEENGKYPVLRVGNLFTNSKWYFSSLELEDDKYCENGDLIYAWSASYGPHIWEGNKVIYHYHIWKTALSSKLDKRFAYYYLQALSNDIAAESHGSAMAHVTMERMNNSYIAYPEIEEQKKISAYLDNTISCIDTIVSEKEKLIAELGQYKQALIFETVTGKRKVV